MWLGFSASHTLVPQAINVFAASMHRERSSVNTTVPWSSFAEAEKRALTMQRKLHNWAKAERPQSTSMRARRAGCGESRASGSAGGPEQPTGGNARTALRSDSSTCIRVRGGFLYLAAVMDWATRRALSTRLSSTLDSSFCVEALEEAMRRYGKPEIFNTDQGSQFTSAAFVGVLQDAKVRFSMDGRGCFLDNIFSERLWRLLKHEAIYLHELPSGLEAQAIIGGWMVFYRDERPHRALGGRTPAEAHGGLIGIPQNRDFSTAPGDGGRRPPRTCPKK